MMDKPVILAVDDELSSLSLLERELKKRYGEDYRVVTKQSVSVALDLVRNWRDAGAKVALVLADKNMPEMNGTDFLGEVRLIDPLAKRVMLVDWGDPEAPQAIFEGCAYNQIEHFTRKPWHSGTDEQFHHEIAELLYDWSRAYRPVFEAVKIVGERWSSRSHELRDLLGRNNVPYGFYPVDSEEGAELLADNGLASSANLPVTIVFGGKVQENPTNREVSEALGVKSRSDQQGCDLVIIGAGPGGLASAVYASSEGLSTTVVEREALGGQAGQSTLIRNYLGFTGGISGEELASRAYQQAWVLGAEFLISNEAVDIRQDAEGYTVALADESELCAKSIIIATGISYRRLPSKRLEELVGAGVFYGSVSSEAFAMRGLSVFVVGTGNSAGQAALHLAKFAKDVTLVSRGPGLSGSMSAYLVTMIERTQNVRLLPYTRVVDGDGPGRIAELTLEDLQSGEQRTVDAHALFVMIGATPHTGWLPEAIARDQDGYIRTGYDVDCEEAGWPLARRPHPLETSMPGIFAVGDVRHGAVKRVAAAVGEGAVAVRYCHEYLASLVEKAA
jgi:thioredoxin reductase (NADPH)